MNGFIHYPQPTYDGTTLTLAGGTVTTSTPVLNITQTWNNNAVNFTAATMNITTTAQAYPAYWMRFQDSGADRVAIGRFAGATVGIMCPDDNVNGIFLNNGGLRLGAVNASVSWASGGILFTNLSTVDTALQRDGAGALAQRAGTTVQASHHYARYVSATNRNYLAIRHASTTLTNVTGGTVTATNLIPAGAVVLGISTRVTTALGTSNGTTGYEVGDGTDPDRWGAITGTAAGTKTTNANWTAASVPIFTAAQNLVITAVGGNFDATGVIYVDVSYAFGDAD